MVERVLPAAARLGFQALRLGIELEAEAVDPDWAAARRAAAIARRRVTFTIAPSGAAELSGRDLPEEPAQDSHDRIVALARVIAGELRAVVVTPDGSSHGPVRRPRMRTRAWAQRPAAVGDRPLTRTPRATRTAG